MKGLKSYVLLINKFNYGEFIYAKVILFTVNLLINYYMEMIHYSHELSFRIAGVMLESVSLNGNLVKC